MLRTSRRHPRHLPGSVSVVLATALVLAISLPASARRGAANPSIDVDKTCASGTTPVGGTISYRIRVANTGDELLQNLLVNDPLLGGDLAAFPNTLLPGTSAQVHLTYTVQPDDPDPLRNTVTVSAVGAGTQQIVGDSATCSSEIEHSPGIEVTKACPDGDAVPGQQITYGITVENVGDETLHDVVVRDPMLGGDLPGFPNVLGIGESHTEHVPYVVQPDDPDPLVNTVTASGRGAVSDEGVADESTCSSGIQQAAPAVDIAKKCPVSAALGDHVTYRIRVRNTGTEPLEEVLVTDELLGGPMSGIPTTIAAGVTVTRHLPYSIRRDAPAPLINEASVSATGSLTQQVVSDTVSCDTTLVGGQDQTGPGGNGGDRGRPRTVRAAGTAFTGSGHLARLSLLALLLALGGSGALLLARRRRRAAT